MYFRQMNAVMFRANNISMLKFFIDKKTQTAINKLLMIDMSFKNTHKIIVILFLESEELVRC